MFRNDQVTALTQIQFRSETSSSCEKTQQHLRAEAVLFVHFHVERQNIVKDSQTFKHSCTHSRYVSLLMKLLTNCILPYFRNSSHGNLPECICCHGDDQYHGHHLHEHLLLSLCITRAVPRNKRGMITQISLMCNKTE